MQKIIKVISGLALLASAAAYASGDMYMQPVSYAKGGFSLGVEGGYAYLNTPEAMFPKSFDTDSFSYSSSNEKGDWAWGAHAGYDFQVTPNMLLGAELGYKDLGASSSSVAAKTGLRRIGLRLIEGDAAASNKISEDLVDFLFTAKYYAWKGFNVFGKAGVAYVHSDIDQTVTSGNTQVDALSGGDTEWRFEPEFALGAGYTFNQHIDLYAYYDHIGDGSDVTTVANDVQSNVYGANSLWLGISYKF